MALGNKEVQRIISKGKNPWRRECHVYDDGYPGNTKWVDGLTQEWSDGWTAEEGLPEATE
ncbi:hypothetical protein IMZ48_07070 [Candidatus Bathyarchaeota archaeon]|nr:hypothetical protein [Candidatus Bathyarchaeota archaeon]